MKYLKIIGLAAVAAMALMAFAGSASAATELCSTNVSPCPAGEGYGAGTKISSSLRIGTTAILTNTTDTVTCKKSGVSGEITETMNATGTPAGNITSVTFEECTDQNNASCSVEVLNKPWHAEVHTESTKSTGNGTMTVSSGGTGAPEAKVVCGGFLSCTFGTELATLGVAGGSTAIVKANAVVMTLIHGFLCPKKAEWDAEYAVTSPAPLWVI